MKKYKPEQEKAEKLEPIKPVGIPIKFSAMLESDWKSQNSEQLAANFMGIEKEFFSVKAILWAFSWSGSGYSLIRHKERKMRAILFGDIMESPTLWRVLFLLGYFQIFIPYFIAPYPHPVFILILPIPLLIVLRKMFKRMPRFYSMLFSLYLPAICLWIFLLIYIAPWFTIPVGKKETIIILETFLLSITLNYGTRNDK